MRLNSAFFMLQTVFTYSEIFQSWLKWKRLINVFLMMLSHKLDVIHEVTLLFSSTKHSIANIYLPNMFDVRLAFDELLFDPNVGIKYMAKKMIDRWEKY